MQLPLRISNFGRILEREMGVCWMIFQQVWAPGAHPAHLECSWRDWQLPAAPVEFGFASHQPWKQIHNLPNPREAESWCSSSSQLGTETNPCPTWQSKISREFR